MNKRSNFGDDCWEENYENGRFNRYPYDEIVSFILKNYKQQSNILDLGCGGGNNSLFCLNEGHSVIAVDGSLSSIAITKELCHNNKSLICLHNDLKELTVNDDSVDCVIDRQSMGHNSKDDIRKIIKELSRVLVKGGKVISFIFSQGCETLENDIHIGDDSYFKFETGPFSKSGYVYFTNKDDILDLFGEFDIVDIRISSSKSLVNSFSNEYFVIEAQKKVD